MRWYAASVLSRSVCASAASQTARLPSVYWDWNRRLEPAYYRRFCGTPPEHLLFALREGLDMIFEEGLDNAFARHRRIAQAVRRAVAVWGRGNTLSLNAIEASEMSNSVTTVLVANGYDIDRFRTTCRERFNVSIATGLGKTMGKAFRIGHMGHINEPMIIGALAGVEATLSICEIPHEAGGVDAAVRFLASA